MPALDPSTACGPDTPDGPLPLGLDVVAAAVQGGFATVPLPLAVERVCSLIRSGSRACTRAAGDWSVRDGKSVLL